MTSSGVSLEPLELRASGIYADGDFAGCACDEGNEYEQWKEEHPCLLEHFAQLESAAAGKLVTVFLDYDGTLTPIVSNPDAAVMSDSMRNVVRQLAQLFPTAIVSGRGREKVQQFVQLKDLFYAGSHGMDIVGPQGAPTEFAFQPAAQYEPLMRQVCQDLCDAVAGIAGAAVEDNKFCVSVHFRNCAASDYAQLVELVEQVVQRNESLRITRGRKVIEVRPTVDWDKGAALLHLLDMLGLRGGEVYCIYIGDDRTDEDAFKVLADQGLGSGVLVSTRAKPTDGRWTLRDPEEVAAFLNRLVAWGQTGANVWHTVGTCNGWRLDGIANPPAMACDGNGALHCKLNNAALDAALPAGTALSPASCVLAGQRR